MMRRQLQYNIDGRFRTRLEILADAYRDADTINDPATRKDYLDAIKKTLNDQDMQRNFRKLIIGVCVGVMFILILIAVSIFYPSTIQEYFSIYKVILAVACACVAALLPGFFKFNSKIIQATSALGVFAAILIFVKPSDNIFTVRIIVQCANSKVLPSCKVLLFLGQEPREANLGTNNDALFENIPVKYLNMPAKIGIKNMEGYSQTVPDSMYKLSNSSILYVMIQLEINNVVSGYITSKKKPLKDVEVTIGELKDTSDVNGFYKIVLLKAGLKDEQTVTFFKKPFAVIRKKVVLHSLENLDIAMDK